MIARKGVDEVSDDRDRQIQVSSLGRRSTDWRHPYCPSDGRSQGDSDQRNLNASRQKGWLTQDELREVNEHLLRLQEIFHGAQRRDDTTFCSLTFVMAPVEQTKAADS